MIPSAYYLVGQVSDATLQVDGLGACFVAGTLIATPHRDERAEDIVAGDVILTASGKRRSVTWVGHSGFSGRFLAVTPCMQPIRFKAGSLGGGLPERDLLVSPEQSLLVDGVLVPAFLLVNGATIAPDRGMARVDYVFIETEGHELLLAEGAAAETFVQEDFRDEFRAIPGATRPEAVAGCAPRMEHGYALEAIRCRLADLAGHISQAA